MELNAAITNIQIWCAATLQKTKLMQLFHSHKGISLQRVIVSICAFELPHGAIAEALDLVAKLYQSVEDPADMHADDINVLCKPKAV